MKQPKKLTYDQKCCLTAHNLNWKEWMFVVETDFYYKIIHKKTGAMRMVDKFVRKKRR